MNTHGIEEAWKENEKSSEKQCKDMEICDINDRQFKTAVLALADVAQ